MSDKHPEKDAIIQALSQSLTISGPLPGSTEYSGYEKTHPGTAERILVMAEKQAAHRQEVEKETIRDAFRLNSRGQVLGFVVAILSIGAVFASLFLNQPLGAIAPAIVALTGLAAIFVGKNHH
jgi:uncharacterized membrane protein